MLSILKPRWIPLYREERKKIGLTEITNDLFFRLSDLEMG